MGDKVSIVTPTHHRDPGIIARCMGCVRAQTHEDWEHILCSDGEFEAHVHSLALVDEDDPRVSYTHTQRAHNDYGYGVRKEMVENVATGDFLVFLDDDNMIMPTYLEKMVKALNGAQDGEEFAICQILHFGPLQQFWGRPPCVLTGVPPKLYYIDTLQIMIRLAAFREVGFQKDFGYFTDGNTYEVLGEKFKWVEVPECLAVHM